MCGWMQAHTLYEEQADDSNNAGFGYGLRLGTGLVYCMACAGLVSIMSRVGGPCAFRLISVAMLAQVCSCFAPDLYNFFTFSGRQFLWLRSAQRLLTTRGNMLR